MNNVDNPFESPAILSFCPGNLGIERGLARAGIHTRVMAYVEIEAYICANLVAGMEAGILDPAPIWTNAKTFDARPFRGRVHGITGGYPCPGESTAGLREGHLYHGFLWPYIRRAIAAARPLWCFFENVDDHLTGTYPIVQRSLRNMGYAVEAGIYSAEEAGAPHERQRLFILAVDNACLSRFKQKYSISAGRNRPELASEAMGNSAGINEQGRRSTTRKRQIGNSGQTLVYSDGPELQGIRNNGIQVEKENKRVDNASHTQWPAGQGQFQYEWEEPRTIEPPLGSSASRNSNGDGVFHVNEIYEIYTTKKTGAIKALHELWAIIDSQKNQWTIGRLFSFLEEEILFTKLHGEIQNKRFAFAITRYQNLSHFQKTEMRNMWIREPIGNSPQGQEYLKQLHGEFADAICILSYQIALARRKETKTGGQSETMQHLWHNYQNTWWDVPEALSKIQKIWRPLSDEKAWRRQIEEAYKSYRLELFGNLFGYNFREDLLRSLGNAVVEQVAEIAFIDLLNKHLCGLNKK